MFYLVRICAYPALIFSLKFLLDKALQLIGIVFRLFLDVLKDVFFDGKNFSEISLDLASRAREGTVDAVSGVVSSTGSAIRKAGETVIENVTVENAKKILGSVTGLLSRHFHTS